MSLVEQFRETGQIGDEFALLTFRTVRAVALTYNYPPPEGTRWDDDNVWAAVSEFFAGGDGQRRLVALATQANSDAHLTSLLQSTVRRWFQSEGRKTEKGRLMRALRRVLDDEPELFVEPMASRWALRAGPQDPSQRDVSALHAVAARLPLPFARVVPDDGPRAPWAPRDVQVLALSAILEAADGSVALSTIADVVARRVGLIAPPYVTELDAPDAPELTAPRDPAPTSADAEHAMAILRQLGDLERCAVATWDESVRSAAQRLAVASSTLHDARRRVETILSAALAGQDEALYRILRDLCDAHLALRTGTADLSSTSGEHEGDQ